MTFKLPTLETNKALIVDENCIRAYHGPLFSVVLYSMGHSPNLRHSGSPFGSVGLSLDFFQIFQIMSKI